MELVITSQDLEPLPKENVDLVNESLGFLNSNYQQVVRSNFNKRNPHSLFGIRQRIKSRRLSSYSSIDTILKVSLFLTISFIIIS